MTPHSDDKKPENIRPVHIIGTGAYVPERTLTNADFEKMVDTSNEWIVTRTGIRERRIAAAGQATSDLCLPAARQALESSRTAASEIDFLIVGTFTPDRPLPSCGCMLQSKLGAKKAAAFDVAAACSGF
ncbi:MAG: 3-oxoacyl-ACP synthase, partial [Planctomycetota bacterium]|nr:3-oxoacyl-ACP synthase [Planctomycetota bacterium]